MLPPGPSGPESLSFIRLMRRNPLDMFQRLQQQYGEISSIQLGPQLICLVTEPALIHRILVHDNSRFKKGRFLELAKELLGDGLLTSEGELHKRQRLLIQPMFHKQMIRAYAEVMAVWGERFANRWQDGQELDLAREMMKLTLAVVGETLFGANVEDEAPDVGRAMEEVLDITIAHRPLAQLLRRLPTPSRERFTTAKGLLDKTIQTIIDSHREHVSDTSSEVSRRQDLIGLLLAARDENGDGMSDQLIRDEALTLFLAGHETTANALAWTWCLLAQSPRVEQLFHQELDTVLQGRAPTAEDLPELKYTRQILTESMRLYPPAWAMGRRALEDYQLGPYQIPKGSVIIISQYLVHRNSRFYTEPERFIPERWTADFKQQMPKYAYFPFSGGPRNCIGEAFAWMEGILLLASLGQRWRFKLLEPAENVGLQAMVTLRPRNGLPMRLESR